MRKKNRMALGQVILVASEAAPGLLLSSPRFLLNLLPWRLPTELSTRGKYTQTWRVSLSICGSNFEVLFAIQVYRFCEMCQEIMNNPVGYS